MKILITLFVFIPLISFSQETRINLSRNWQFCESGKKAWRNADVPGTIHTDLINHKLIPDPYFRDHEKQVQWVEEKTWLYKNTFRADAALLKKKNIYLVFEGLDTYAEVYLNGKKIFLANNMFRKWEQEIKSYLVPGINSILIKFLPAALLAKEQKKSSTLSYPDNERVFIRKAQYQFGWDWGPRLVTCGIWKPVYISAFDKEVKNEKSSASTGVKLVNNKDQWGESFYFTLKGKPVFIKGANWIPVDNFLPRAKKRKIYQKLLLAAKTANINMLRVWGGGVYEDDLFYELCDKYGIMVWQDFMFAGALYPADDSFLKNIEDEVRYQVKRLRHHKTIVLWCGNNEIEEAWFNWGWQKQLNYSQEDSTRLWNDYRKIFHKLIPDILKELDPERPYWPSSPSLGWGRDSAYLKGDVHYWGVWWGKEPVEQYKTKAGRFNSEYGMQGMPDMKTILSFARDTELDTAHAIMQSHQKHPFGFENLKLYIDQKFKSPKNFSDFVYVSQLMQADAIKTAIEAHRSNMPYTMGTLFWQWNDCWPVVSWSALDYYARPKALYYQVKRNFAPRNLFLSQKENSLIVSAIDEDHELKGYYTIKGIHFDGSTELIAEKLSVSEKTTIDIGHFYTSGSINQKLILVEWKDSIKGEILASAIHLFVYPKHMLLKKPGFIVKMGKDQITIQSDKFAYGVKIDLPDGIELEDNYFHLLPGEERNIQFRNTNKNKKAIIPLVTSLFDTF